MNNRISLLFAFGIFLSGCGVHQAIESTNSVPEKLDKTIEKMEETIEKLKETECALKRGISFEALLKDEYGRDLAPVPFDLMPFAREFAKCSSAEDLAEVTYMWMKKLNEVTLDLPNPTPVQVEEFNHRKMHVYSALQAVAGFIPQDKLEKIIQAQLYGAGRYQDSVMELLMLRVQFLRDVMLENSLFSKGLNNVGTVEKAVEYAQQIDYIARLPFAGEIAVNVTGFVAPMDDVQETLNPAQAPLLWGKIKSKAERLNVEMKTWTGQAGEDQQLWQNRQVRMTSALSTINLKVSEWSRRP